MDREYPRVKNRAIALEKAENHFSPVLTRGYFVLEPERLNPSGTAKMEIRMYPDQFIDVFGDLVEQGNYYRSSFRKRIKELDMKIGENVLDLWIQTGCLLWD